MGDKPDFIKEIEDDEYPIDAYIDFSEKIIQDGSMLHLIEELHKTGYDLFKTVEKRLSKKKRKEFEDKFDSLESKMTRYL